MVGSKNKKLRKSKPNGANNFLLRNLVTAVAAPFSVFSPPAFSVIDMIRVMITHKRDGYENIPVNFIIGNLQIILKKKLMKHKAILKYQPFVCLKNIIPIQIAAIAILS